MSSIIVTGAAGFFCSHLIPRLLDEGNMVTGVDIVHPSETWRLASVREHPNFTYHWGSAGDFIPMHDAIVVHAAAVTDVNFSRGNPAYTFERNTGDCARLLWEAYQQEARQVIIFSSHSVYGPGLSQPISEDVPLRASNFYGAAKVAQESIAMSYWSERQLPVAVVRPALMYGERERPGALVSTFIQRALSGQKIRLDGGGKQSRDMNYAGNTVDAVMLMLNQQWAHGEIFNIGSGEEITIRQLAELSLAYAGREFASSITVAPARAGEEGRLVVDSGKLAAHGYVPKVKFEEGFRRTAEWMTIMMKARSR